jgi:CRP-like cAMP-binding protein
MPVIEDINYDDSATVLENAELIQIPREDFMTILNSDATIATKFIQLAANSTREKEERLINLAYSSLRKRIAVSLIELSKKFNPKDVPGTTLNITRENFARYVGTATESAIRIMTDFRDEKLIDIDSAGRISIININKLTNLVN